MSRAEPEPHLLTRLSAWLATRPRAVTWLILLGVGLTGPSLFTGLVADDWLHQLLLREQPGIPGLTPRTVDLFRFASGDALSARQLMNHGVFPWWADPDLVLAFLRPLSAVTHWVDHRAWPEWPVLMHLQSLAWFGLLLWLVGRAYVAFAATRAEASLALLLFAVDHTHAPAVGWIANRSQLIALALTLLALLLHDRARRTSSRRRATQAALVFGLALSAGEAALGGLAYLLAYALFLDRRSVWSRLASLVPYALLIFTWRLVYLRLGYGARGSDVYLDPGTDPLGFLRAAVTRVPVLLQSTFALPWSDLWDVYPLFLPSLRVLVLELTVLTGGLLVALLRPSLCESARARFWATGCLLSVVPSAATFPHDRLLLAPTVGAMALLSHLMLEARGPSRWRRRLVAGFAVLHLAVSPVLLAYRSANVSHLSRLLERANATLPGGLEPSSQTWILINPPLVPFAAYLPLYREAAHQPRPRRWLWLSTGVSELRIERLDENTLSVRPELGYWTDPTQLLLRSTSKPLRRGEKVTLDDATFEVTALTADGRPAEVVVRFARELRDRHLVFLRWQEHGYAPFAIPAVGEAVVLPRVHLSSALSG